jgi:hypothetical protein
MTQSLRKRLGLSDSLIEAAAKINNKPVVDLGTLDNVEIEPKPQIKKVPKEQLFQKPASTPESDASSLIQKRQLSQEETQINEFKITPNTFGVIGDVVGRMLRGGGIKPPSGTIKPQLSPSPKNPQITDQSKIDMPLPTRPRGQTGEGGPTGLFNRAQNAIDNIPTMEIKPSSSPKSPTVTGQDSEAIAPPSVDLTKPLGKGGIGSDATAAPKAAKIAPKIATITPKTPEMSADDLNKISLNLSKGQDTSTAAGDENDPMRAQKRVAAERIKQRMSNAANENFVYHAKFGLGEILTISENTYDVLFEHGIEKNMPEMVLNFFVAESSDNVVNQLPVGSNSSSINYDTQNNPETIQATLMMTADRAVKLSMLLKSNVQIEDWMETKISTAFDYINSIFDYLNNLNPGNENIILNPKVKED